MALFGNLYNLKPMFQKSESLESLYKYLKDALDFNSSVNKRIISLNCANDRVESKIDLGFGMIAIEQSYKLNNGIFESHEKFVDFQLMVNGFEYMEFGDIGDFEVSSQYDSSRDVILYHNNNKTSKLFLKNTSLAVFFPYDVHRGGGIIYNTNTIVYKSVVKVPNKLLKFCF